MDRHKSFPEVLHRLDPAMARRNSRVPGCEKSYLTILSAPGRLVEARIPQLDGHSGFDFRGTTFNFFLKVSECRFAPLNIFKAL